MAIKIDAYKLSNGQIIENEAEAVLVERIMENKAKLANYCGDLFYDGMDVYEIREVLEEKRFLDVARLLIEIDYDQKALDELKYNQ